LADLEAGIMISREQLRALQKSATSDDQQKMIQQLYYLAKATEDNNGAIRDLRDRKLSGDTAGANLGNEFNKIDISGYLMQKSGELGDFMAKVAGDAKANMDAFETPPVTWKKWYNVFVYAGEALETIPEASEGWLALMTLATAKMTEYTIKLGKLTKITDILGTVTGGTVSAMSGAAQGFGGALLGITPAQMAKMFDPYSKGQVRTAEKGEVLETVSKLDKGDDFEYFKDKKKVTVKRNDAGEFEMSMHKKSGDIRKQIYIDDEKHQKVQKEFNKKEKKGVGSTYEFEGQIYLKNLHHLIQKN